MGRIENKIAIITGAAGGIGLATAELFAREGATVVMTDINIGKLEAQGRRMTAEGLTVTVEAHDVTRPDDWDRIISVTREKHGRLDILVNNAGVGHLASVEDETLEGWRRILGINLDAVFLGTQKAIAAMKAQGGSIVNIASIEGIIGESALAAYNASKGGGAHLYQVGRPALRRAGVRDSREFHPSGLCPYPHGHRHDGKSATGGGRGDAERSVGAHSPGTTCPARRNRPGDPLRGLGRVELHDRFGAGDRRRLHRTLRNAHIRGDNFRENERIYRRHRHDHVRQPY